VYVFYTATQPGSYDYNVNQQNFGVNFSVVNRLLDFYFKTNRTSYDNIHNADNLLLSYLTEDIYGISMRYKVANAGVELDDYKSSIVPYKMVRYFASLQGNVKQKLLYSVNANWRDYKMPTDSVHRIYRDVNAMLSYTFSRKSRLDVTVGYQSQEGRQINLDQFTGRVKFSTVIKKLTFVAGVDAYDRVYLDNQKMNFVGAYLQVIKKFKY
jgi:hypothetical protein